MQLLPFLLLTFIIFIIFSPIIYLIKFIHYIIISKSFKEFNSKIYKFNMKFMSGINQAGGSVLYEQENFTISAWSYKSSLEGNKFAKFMKVLINMLFFWQKDHCKNAYIWEVKNDKKSLKRLIKLKKGI